MSPAATSIYAFLFLCFLLAFQERVQSSALLKVSSVDPIIVFGSVRCSPPDLILRNLCTAERTAAHDFQYRVLHVVASVQVDRGRDDGRVEVRGLVFLEFGHVKNMMKAF